MATIQELNSWGLGKKWILPFGKTRVMSQETNGSTYTVYIEGIFGESGDTFINAFDAINKGIEHGCIVPDTIKVVCVSGKEIEGRYLELYRIVTEIAKEKAGKVKEAGDEFRRVASTFPNVEIVKKPLIIRILNRLISWSFRVN